MSHYPLSNAELLSWLSSHDTIQPILGGVYSYEDLPRDRHHCKPTLYIVNTGRHWVGVLVGVPISEYFDSLGQRPSTGLIHFLGRPYIVL